MKIAYIMSMARSGITAWNYRELDTLQKQGVEIFAFPLKWGVGPYMPKPDWHFRKPSPIRSLIHQLGAIIKWPGKYVQLFAEALHYGTIIEFLLAADYSQEMAQCGVEHIHCHFGDRKFYTGYYCSKFLDLTLTVTVHAYEILVNPNPKMFCVAADRAERVLTVSEFNKKEIVRLFGVDESKITVMHLNGDLSADSSNSKVKLFIAAEFCYKKGHEVLFKALKKLDRDDILLWVAGQGILDIEKLAEDIGVSHQVVFLGRVGKNMINILYDSCDIFVLPSRTSPEGDREGIPVAIMEAMSHAKPVISTIHVGIPELVSEVLVPENDVDSLAKAIAFLADNPNERKRQGQNNLEIIKQEYSESEVDKLKRLFSEIISSVE